MLEVYELGEIIQELARERGVTLQLIDPYTLYGCETANPKIKELRKWLPEEKVGVVALEGYNNRISFEYLGLKDPKSLEHIEVLLMNDGQREIRVIRNVGNSINNIYLCDVKVVEARNEFRKVDQTGGSADEGMCIYVHFSEVDGGFRHVKEFLDTVLEK